MTWLPRDCHAHTTFSDGTLSVAELVERVRARGVLPSVADHLSGDVAYAIKEIDEVEEYLEELEQHDVGRGGEFCWHDPLWRELPPELDRRFTHLIGSLHGVFLPSSDEVVHAFRPMPAGLTPDAYMDIHIDNAERFAREMPVDILAHPTLVPMALYRYLPPEELWSEAHEERLVEALHRAGIAFEISTRYPPHERLVRRAVAAGVRVSLGSDGHTAKQVGDIAAPLALARAVGVRDEDLYDPVTHGRRAPASR
jgi:histidinol phosphatase-like PHP family hydrolase